jgi:hypothetical protein
VNTILNQCHFFFLSKNNLLIIELNVILPLSKRIRTKITYTILVSYILATCPPIRSSGNFIFLVILSDLYDLQSSSLCSNIIYFIPSRSTYFPGHSAFRHLQFKLFPQYNVQRFKATQNNWQINCFVDNVTFGSRHADKFQLNYYIYS